MDDYKVKKDRFYVTLFLLDGSTKEGFIYLSSHAARHEGPEFVIDVLRQSEQFLPINLKDGSTPIINKDQILMMSFPSENGEAVEVSSGETRVHQVSVHLVNHDKVEGRFISVLPEHAQRVKDFLNQKEPFLELIKDDGIYLINKVHVVFVEEK